MTKNNIAVAAALWLCAAVAAAQTVTVTAPGQVSQTVTDKNAAALAVAGPVDAADLYWIADNMTALTDLDLSGTIILAYEGDLLKGRANYEAQTVPTGAFAGCRLQRVALPATQGTRIGEAAFASTPLAQLPSGMITAVGMGAFAGCNALTTVTLPDIPIGPYAFAHCTALAAVTPGATASTIPASAFEGCSALTRFDCPRALRTVGDRAFSGTALQTAAFSAATALDSVGAWAFAHCHNLENAVFDTQATFGQGAFFDCPGLKTLDIAGVVRGTLPAYMLHGTPGVEVAALAEGTDSIGAYALKGNTATAQITLPSTLAHIGEGAFENTTALTKIDASALQSVPSLEDAVFAGIDQPKVTLTVNRDAADDFGIADQWREFNIQTTTDSNEAIADNIAGPTLQGIFEGDTFVARATGADIAAISLYNPGGILLTSLTPGTAQVRIDTTPFATNLFIVTARLSDGSTATLKTAKR